MRERRTIPYFVLSAVVGVAVVAVDVYRTVTGGPLPPIHLHEVALAVALAAYATGLFHRATLAAYRFGRRIEAVTTNHDEPV